MKIRQVTIIGALLCLPTPNAALAQAHLAWDACGAAGHVDRSFACDVNTTLHQMVSSFIAPPGITNFVGATTEVIVAGNLGPWWGLMAGGCRSGALSAEDPYAVGLPGCDVPYEGSTCLALANYEPNYGGDPRRGRITAASCPRSDEGIALTPGTEYQATIIQLRSSRTVGASACSGCAEPVCFVTSRVQVAEVWRPCSVCAPRFRETVIPGGDQAFVLWQGGAITDPAGCPGATANRRQTWGLVKSLYR